MRTRAVIIATTIAAASWAAPAVGQGCGPIGTVPDQPGPGAVGTVPEQGKPTIPVKAEAPEGPSWEPCVEPGVSSTVLEAEPAAAPEATVVAVEATPAVAVRAEPRVTG